MQANRVVCVYQFEMRFISWMTGISSEQIVYSITKICLIWFLIWSKKSIQSIQPTVGRKTNTPKLLLRISKLLLIDIWFIHYAAFLRMIFHIFRCVSGCGNTLLSYIFLHRWIFHVSWGTNGDMAISNKIIQDNGFLSMWMKKIIIKTRANSVRYTGRFRLLSTLRTPTDYDDVSKTYIMGKKSPADNRHHDALISYLNGRFTCSIICGLCKALWEAISLKFHTRMCACAREIVEWLAVKRIRFLDCIAYQRFDNDTY